MKATIAQSTIARLNQIARSNVRKGEDVVSALTSAAAALGLTEVRRDDESILFRNKHRAYVNCWIEGPFSQDIVDGGAGFDDQIEWAFE